MAKHEFGMMQTPPVSGQRYDEYEPEKYDCISVEDEDLVPLLETLSDVPFFWHTVDMQRKGLAYCGITLIPPSSITKMLPIIERFSAVAPLTALLKRAAVDNKFVIHFGI